MRVLLTGIDTLQVGFYGRLPAADLSRVETAARVLRKGKEPDPLELGGVHWRVQGPTRFAVARLVSRVGTLCVTNPSLPANPGLTWEPDCMSLWVGRDRWVGAWATGHEIAARAFGEAPSRSGVTRLDMACDVEHDFSAGPSPDDPAWVTRAKRARRRAKKEKKGERGKKPPEVDTSDECEVDMASGEITGMRWAPGNPLMVRLYNKVREINEKSGKRFFWTLWDEDCCADTRPQRVWRLEAQIRREWLKGCGIVSTRTGELLSIDTPTGLAEALPRLWAYVTGQWLTWRQPAADTHRHRWEVRDEWRQVQGARWACGPGLPSAALLWEERRRTSWEEMLPAVRGYLLALAARAPESGLGPGELWHRHLLPGLRELEERKGLDWHADLERRELETRHDEGPPAAKPVAG